MFRFLSLVCFLAMFAWLVFSLRKKSGKSHMLKQGFCNFLSNTTDVCKNIKKVKFFEVIKYLLFPLTLTCILVLAITGFFPAIILGKPLSGYLLVIHVMAAPVFAFCVAVMSIVWAHKHCFNEKDWNTLKLAFNKISSQDSIIVPTQERGNEKELLDGNEKEYSDRTNQSVWQKISFWLIIGLAIPIILSILSSMYPIFGSHGQEFLLQLHRYCTMLFVIIFTIFTYLLVLKIDND